MYRSLATASLRAPTKFFRPFSVSASRTGKTGKYPDDKHATDKVKEGDTHDVQTENTKAGLDANKDGGAAAEGRDSAGGAKKAKKEFPEAPDTIGMQDERGGRGG
ncbi:uncharacterized protein K460DRAFT_404635 [Cucurbitaria berberidis CBS 394.84]|uniref:Uncharacterized protein n=1 Tax=Cucurbitaria berberidis CBS 394.84 TaxID=1168544 RepID=A0A9P4GPG3_9PLEO|nr:uncharacterized protein K460DRAFT_404635 [Cucurbitaria berberidis CBS 394.84]KAF1849407.1 hypothetical protein K460DRAFT_404635 [Cucurbitaria berberidis CBS 394.84]